MKEADQLKRIYEARFKDSEAYRMSVWRTLMSDFFSPYIPRAGSVLDLGCGYGVFINQVAAAERYGMDLNPKTAGLLEAEVHFLQQDCSEPWPLAEGTLDLVFTSNFFEHLPDKASLSRTLEQAHRCLRSGGRLIAMGPNARCLPGAYWDFWDHYLPLTERSLGEACELHGFGLERQVARFLPYKMTHGPRYPMWCLKFYLKCPLVWSLFGKQFLVVAVKPA